MSEILEIDIIDAKLTDITKKDIIEKLTEELKENYKTLTTNILSEDIINLYKFLYILLYQLITECKLCSFKTFIILTPEIKISPSHKIYTLWHNLILEIEDYIDISVQLIPKDLYFCYKKHMTKIIPHKLSNSLHILSQQTSRYERTFELYDLLFSEEPDKKYFPKLTYDMCNICFEPIEDIIKCSVCTFKCCYICSEKIKKCAICKNFFKGFQIFIKDNSTCIIRHIQPCTSILHLKNRISHKINFSDDRHKLMYGGKMLDQNNRTVIDYSLHENSTIFMSVRLRGY